MIPIPIFDSNFWNHHISAQLLETPPRAGAVKFGWVEHFIQGNGTGIPGNPGGCKTICPWMPTFGYPRDPYQFGKNYQRVLLQRVPNHLRNSRNSSMRFSTPRKRNFRGRQLKIGGRKPREKPHFSQRRGAEIPHPGREGLTWRVLLEEGGKEKPLQVWSSPEERLLYPRGRADDSRLNSVTRIFHNQNRLRSRLLELSQRLGQIPPLPGAGDWVFFHGRHTQGCSSRDDLLIICLVPVLGRDPTKNRELGRLASAPE